MVWSVPVSEGWPRVVLVMMFLRSICVYVYGFKGCCNGSLWRLGHVIRSMTNASSYRSYNRKHMYSHARRYDDAKSVTTLLWMLCRDLRTCAMLMCQREWSGKYILLWIMVLSWKMHLMLFIIISIVFHHEDVISHCFFVEIFFLQSQGLKKLKIKIKNTIIHKSVQLYVHWYNSKYSNANELNAKIKWLKNRVASNSFDWL